MSAPQRTPSATTPPGGPSRRWQRFGGKFLVLSILGHLLFGAIAAYLIVQRFQSTHKQTFQSGPKGPNASSRALEYQVQAKRRKAAQGAPPQPRRVVTTGPSKVSLPSMPAMPSMTTPLIPLSMSGMGAGGVAPGGFGGGGGGGGGGGAGINFFGVRTGGAGLPGTFYDYKMEPDFQPIKGMNTKQFARVVHDVLPTGGAWHPDQPYRHFTSPAKLYGRYFYFPAIQDREAGSAFQSPRSGPGSWLAVYRGAFAAPSSGSLDSWALATTS